MASSSLGSKAWSLQALPSLGLTPSGTCDGFLNLPTALRVLLLWALMLLLLLSRTLFLKYLSVPPPQLQVTFSIQCCNLPSSLCMLNTFQLLFLPLFLFFHHTDTLLLDNLEISHF
jgi:hypothetical protein